MALAACMSWQRPSARNASVWMRAAWIMLSRMVIKIITTVSVLTYILYQADGNGCGRALQNNNAPVYYIIMFENER